jgi:PAS domain-containing protein
MPKKKKVRAGKKTTKPELAASWPSLPPDFPPSPEQRRRSITDLGPHEHAAFLFSDEAEWAAVVPSFIVSGLEKNEKCVVILDSHEINLLRQPLVRAGLNIEAVTNSGQLVIIPAAEAYLRRGSFSPEEMITFLKEETEKALSEGYAALRATGEMTWALRPSSDLGKLFEYEARLNHDFFPHYPCIGLCQYDRRRFTGAALKEIVLSHPLLSFHDGVYQNFYYFPPEEYFDPRRAELEVDRWLKNLIDAHSALEALEENAERFRSLYQNSTIGLYRTTPDGRILLANPTLVRMLGYDSFEELAPRNLEKDGFEPSYPRA